MANIPRAYDVLPSQTAIASHEGMQQTLLLSEQEQQWQAEMAAEGAAHLPVAWYRQTPRQAVRSGYGIANQIINGLVNLGINAGLGYGILKGKDVVGLWQEPDAGSSPYKSAAFSDLLLTAVLVTFFTCLISTPGIRGAMKKGQIVPVEGYQLKGGCLTCTPIRMLGTCTRSLLLSLWALIVLGIPFVLLLAVVCGAGGMEGAGSQCYMEQQSYIWLKAVYSLVVAMVIYPLVMLSAINAATLPPLDLTLFLDAQKQRWEQEKRKQNPQPL